jgi:hypothetical protein
MTMICMQAHYPDRKYDTDKATCTHSSNNTGWCWIQSISNSYFLLNPQINQKAKGGGACGIYNYIHFWFILTL